MDDESDHVAFFQTPGLIVASGTAGSSTPTPGSRTAAGGGGVTLAYNVRSPDEVDAVLGGPGRGGDYPPLGAPTFWGGYSGVFIDPDGHPWDVAHNPDWAV